MQARRGSVSEVQEHE